MWQYYRAEPVLDDNGNIFDFPTDYSSTSCTKDGKKDVEKMVPLKYLSNFWRTSEMSVSSCEISLQLKWSKKRIIVAGTENNQNPSFQINDTKLYVPVVTLSTQENIKLLKQLESVFKIIINWNKYLTKATNQAWNRYLDYLNDPSFQGVNRLFLLSFKDNDDGECHKQYYLPTVE